MDLGIVVGVQIDEARRHDEPCGVDHRGAGGVVDLADLGDAAAADGEVAAESRQAGAVDDSAVLNNRVVLGHVVLPLVSLSCGRPDAAQYSKYDAQNHVKLCLIRQILCI